MFETGDTQIKTIYIFTELVPDKRNYISDIVDQKNLIRKQKSHNDK